jgi:hypothetical protein
MHTSRRFLPAFFSRLLATLCVLVLMGSLSLVCILGLAWSLPAISHGLGVSHMAGQILSLKSDRSFVLLTATGQRLSFQCETDCRASFAHMQRHWQEHARTDVYYIQGPKQVLMALDVD